MIFECVSKTGHRTEKWQGEIIYFKDYGTYCEIKIESRSSILVIFGKTSRGRFACMPDFGVGCYLVNPSDKFWNTEQLIRVLGRVDGITVASALYSLADNIKF
mgnify:CR=1 FL=1|jgi:hypothetical protein